MDLIRGCVLLSRGRVWGFRSGTGGNKVCVKAKAVGNDSLGITVGITIWGVGLLDREHGRSCTG